MKNRIVATLLMFCLVLALLSGTALAANKSGTCGRNATWTLTIKGVGGV